MIESLSPQNILNHLEKDLVKELFNLSNYPKLMTEELLNMHKRKNPDKMREFPNWEIFEIGYTGVIYKVFIALNSDGSILHLFGFLDTFSEHPIVITNDKRIDLTELKKKGFIPCQRHGKRYGITAMIVLSEKED